MVSFMTIKAGTKVRLFCALRFTIGAILLWGVAYRSVLPNPRPSFLSPFPKSVIFFDYILFDSIHFHAYAKCLAALVIPMAFALWSIPLLWGQTRIPIRSKILTVVLALMSVLYLAGTWSEGIQYHGVLHTILMYLFNALFCALLFTIAMRNSRNLAYASNYLFHWILFAWLGWVAFPYLGELA